MREKISLDKGWKFLLDDPRPNKCSGHQEIYMASKSQRGRGLAARDYYDVSWEDIDVPHDYQILGEYNENLEGNHGYLPKNNAWYRRNFYLNKEDVNKRISIIFDGIATHCTVWINGHLMERNFCGYNAFEIDVTPVVKEAGEANVIAIRVINDEHEGWWYEGAGIYRHVWLIKTDKLAVSNWGTFVKPVKRDNDWIVQVETSVVNQDYENKDIQIRHRLKKVFQSGEVNDWIDIKKKKGQIAGYVSSDMMALKACKIKLNHQNFVVNDPDLWTTDKPVLYALVTELIQNGIILDTYETEFGFRTLVFDSDKGFFLNGVKQMIKGVCGHQDHGGLGVAVTEPVWEMRLKKLKSMGCNAYRVGHTPASSEFLRLCDRIGILVMNESRWFESSRIGKLQLENMIRKDRNNPCIFIWSVGNEEPVQSTDVGKRIAEDLVAFVKTMDDSRPVTVALNGGYFDEKVTAVSDLIGINYTYQAYDKVKQLHPDKPIFSPEVGATDNHRSVYKDIGDGRQVAYDEVAASFGTVHRKAWDEVVTRPYIFGMFVWTGFEYRGESLWPLLFAGGGAFDSSGYKKDNFYYFKAIWTQKPMIHLLPHWNLDLVNGEPVKVVTYSNMDEVELFINGTSHGKRTNDQVWQLEWSVLYEKGEIKAIGYKNGRSLCQCIRRSQNDPFHIKVEEVKTTQWSQDHGTHILDVMIVDEYDELAQHIDTDMSFELEGMTLLGTGNGDPIDHGPNQSYERNIYRGLCQILVRMDQRVATIKVKSKKYGMCNYILKEKNDKRYVYDQVTKGQWKIEHWWKGPVSQSKPDWNRIINHDDVNTWEPVTLEKSVFEGDKAYRHYYVTTKMPSFNDNLKSAMLLLKEISGKVSFKVEHAKDYWPLPEPEEYLSIERYYKGNRRFDSIELKGFKKDEKILLHIITDGDSSESSGIGSIEWSIE